MTFFVTLFLIFAAFIGVVVIIRALGPSPRQREDVALGTQTACKHCNHLNPTHARFCGHCGKPLS
jgi:hypothetical protein